MPLVLEALSKFEDGHFAEVADNYLVLYGVVAQEEAQGVARCCLVQDIEDVAGRLADAQSQLKSLASWMMY